MGDYLLGAHWTCLFSLEQTTNIRAPCSIFITLYNNSSGNFRNRRSACCAVFGIVCRFGNRQSIFQVTLFFIVIVPMYFKACNFFNATINSVHKQNFFNTFIHLLQGWNFVFIGILLQIFEICCVLLLGGKKLCWLQYNYPQLCWMRHSLFSTVARTDNIHRPQ